MGRGAPEHAEEGLGSDVYVFTVLFGAVVAAAFLAWTFFGGLLLDKQGFGDDEGDDAKRAGSPAQRREHPVEKACDNNRPVDKGVRPPVSGSAPPAPSPTKTPPPRPHERALPETPRSAAKRMVGSRLSTEQAAEKIMALQPYVKSRKVAQLTAIWGFFDMEVPRSKSLDPQDRIMQTLKTKLNRLRLLLHPDKNSHPDAEATFKFLEQCHQRLMSSFCSKSSRSAETVHQRTRREEEELRVEAERRRQHEEAWRRAEEQRQREEDERQAKSEREAAERIRRQKEGEERLKAMLRDKEARGSLYAQQRRELISGGHGRRAPSPPPAADPVATTGRAAAVDDVCGATPDRLAGMAASVSSASAGERPRNADLPSGLFAATCTPSVTFDDDVDAPRPRSVLDETVWETGRATEPPGEGDARMPPSPCSAARDLPSQGAMFSTDAYAVACIGTQRFSTPRLPGDSPAWGCTLNFNVFRVDTALRVEVYRDGLAWGLFGEELLGTVEVPFLDLEEWSGCPIGRVIQPAQVVAAAGSCMVLELQCSIEWF